MLGNLRADVTLTGKHQANGLDHFSEPGALGHVTGSAGLQQTGRERIFFTDGDSDDLDIRVAAQHLARRFQTSDTRHLDVHQHDVGLELARFFQGFLAGIGLSDNLQTINVGQHACDACPDKIMVIDN